MNFDVPQYIEVEDKIAFHLTAKQLGWFASGGVVIFILWNFVAEGYFIFWSIIVVLFVLAFAFFRPYGLSLASFFGHGFMYFFKPKQFIWRRQINVSVSEVTQPEIVPQSKSQNKTKDLTEVQTLAEKLDSKHFQ
jgi:hypothetical protein